MEAHGRLHCVAKDKTETIFKLSVAAVLISVALVLESVVQRPIGRVQGQHDIRFNTVYMQLYELHIDCPGRGSNPGPRMCSLTR